MTDNNYRLTPQEAQQTIRGIAKLGSITPLPHCWKRMRERNFSLQDIEYLLSKCIVTDPPEYDEKDDDWKYEAKGYVIDGDRATVITLIVSHRELYCKTIMDK
jgi:hypothetical protein